MPKRSADPPHDLTQQNKLLVPRLVRAATPVIVVTVTKPSVYVCQAALKLLDPSTELHGG